MAFEALGLLPGEMQEQIRQMRNARDKGS